MKLYPELAEKVIREKIAQPLNLSLQDAAYTIFTGVNINMVTAIEELTIWQGIDPHEYLFVGGGAAAGLHVMAICKELGTKEVLMPKTAGGLSAVGGVFGDMVGEYAVGYLTESNHFDFEIVNVRLQELEQRASAFLDRNGIPAEKRRIEFYCEARYPYQIWELPVLLRVNQINSEKDLAQLVEDFHEVHERVFAVKEDTYIECIHWRVRAIGVVDRPNLADAPLAAEDPTDALTGQRRIYLGPELGECEASVYSGDKLKPGNKVAPPGIIQEETTTILLMPGGEATVTRFGNYLIKLGYTDNYRRG